MTGTSSLNRVIWLDCSIKAPCSNITLDGFDVKHGKDDLPKIHHVCNNVVMDPKNGLDMCHSNGDKVEGECSPGDESL
jgi:galacturan 1,4-alpha-galacturonidase